MRRLKNFFCTLLLIIGCFLLFGCEKHPENVSITSDWQLVEMSTDGNVITDRSFLSSEDSPKFHSDNGEDFVFSINGKDHTGVLSLDSDRYILVYDDTDKQMEAIIDGNTLRISIVDGTSYFIFKAV